jgi:hypothetical protein
MILPLDATEVTFKAKPQNRNATFSIGKLNKQGSRLFVIHNCNLIRTILSIETTGENPNPIVGMKKAHFVLAKGRDNIFHIVVHAVDKSAANTYVVTAELYNAPNDQVDLGIKVNSISHTQHDIIVELMFTIHC